MNSKQCTKCKQIKNIDKFTKDKQQKDGHSCYCVACRKEINIKNKEKRKIRDAKYFSENKEWISKKRKASYQKNKETILLDIKEYRLKNKEHIKKVRAEYYQKNKQKHLDNMAKYYEENTEKVKKRTAKYAKTDKGIAIRRNVWHKRTMLHRETDITTEYLKNKLDKSIICYYCFKILDEKHIDHFTPVAKGGKHIMSNIVISCPTCNLTKSAKDPIKFIYSL